MDLLRNMHQLMRQQRSSVNCLRCISPGSKHYISPYRERLCLDGLRGPCCIRARVKSYLTEVVTDARFH
jgi:hypothetical protein